MVKNMNNIFRQILVFVSRFCLSVGLLWVVYKVSYVDPRECKVFAKEGFVI